MPAPQNLWRLKNRPKIFAIFDNFQLWSQICPERINISKIGKLLIIYNPSHFGRKKLGVLWSTNEKVIDSNICTPKWTFFRETLSRPLGMDDKLGTIFTMPAPKNLWRPKNRQACRGYVYPWINPWIYLWIYPCVDMSLWPCCGYIHGYYAGTPANKIDYFICFVSHFLTFASFIFNWKLERHCVKVP